jgi:hypothetical protein
MSSIGKIYKVYFTTYHFFCVYFNILLYVNKKINIWDEDAKKNYIVLRNLIPLSSNSPTTAHSKPNGRYPAYPKIGISKI